MEDVGGGAYPIAVRKTLAARLVESLIWEMEEYGAGLMALTEKQQALDDNLNDGWDG